MKINLKKLHILINAEYVEQVSAFRRIDFSRILPRAKKIIVCEFT